VNVGHLSLVKQDSSMYKSSVQMQGLWSTAAESPDRMYVLQAHHVVLILAESECDRGKTAALVMYGVQKHGRYPY
jgi:hypothetical protein